MQHQPQTEWATLTNSQLIERLPDVGFETFFNFNTGRYDEDAASLEFKKRIERGDVSPQEIGTALKRVGILRSSPRWFRGKPYRAWFRLPRWTMMEGVGVWASATPVTVNDVGPFQTIKADAPTDFFCAVAHWGQAYEESYQCVGDLSVDATSVTFDIELRSNAFSTDQSSSRKIIDTLSLLFTISLPVEVVEEAAPKPIADEELTQLVKRYANVMCINGDFKNGPSAWPKSWFHRPATGRLSNTIVRLELALLDNEQQIYTNIANDPDGLYTQGPSIDDDVFLRGDIARNFLNRENLDRYTLRVRGIPPGKEGNQWCREFYWAGEYSTPLKDVLAAPVVFE